MFSTLWPTVRKRSSTPALHLDNVLFGGRGEGRSPVVLDWQTATVASPAWDVALLFGSLSVEDRCAAEAALLDRYAALRADHGVRGYTVSKTCELTAGWPSSHGWPERSAG